MIKQKRIKISILYFIAIAVLCAAIYVCYKKATVKVVYLAPGYGGQLSNTELKNYPQIIRVSNSFEMKLFSSKKSAIWIDKDALNSLDEDWLFNKLQNKVPIALIGWDNPIYLFSNKLSAVHLPSQVAKRGDGFAFWMQKDKSNPQSIFKKGYNSTPNTKEILIITNMLLEENYPE